MSTAHKINEGNMSKHSTETRMALLELNNSHTIEILKDIKQGLNRVETKIDNLDKKMDEKFDKINSRIWTNFYWGAGGFASVLGVLAHAMKWI
jgi:hypothetical protein